MCGLIVGVTQSNFGFARNDRVALEELLFMDTLRGPDSTGVCLVKKDMSVRVAKKATWGPAFLVSKAYQETSNQLFTDGKFFMGHNRKATVGEVSSDNAHPFIVNNELVLMHNGSLVTHKHLADTKVDSEAIAQYLHEKWDDDATPTEKGKILQHIGGAWALVWYDLRTEKLNIVRNNERPLFIYRGKDLTLMASDQHMLQCAMARNSLYGTIAPVPVYTLLTYSNTGSEEVTLPTPSFFTSQSKHTTHTSKPTTKGNADGHVSKNNFKKIAKEYAGRTIIFNVDGCVTVKGSRNFWGEKTELDFNHEIVGLYHSDTMMGEIEDNYGMAKGMVMGTSYNKITGYVTFQVRLLGPAKYANEASTCH